MKKIGIVGGLSWRSTVDYYTGLCSRAEELHLAKGLNGTPPMPEMAIESLDLKTAFSYLGDGDEESWARYDEYHRAALVKLETSGAEIAVMAANSPHHRFEAITHGIGIPVISIFDAAAKECVRMGARQVLILGTPLIMGSAKFRQHFAKYGIEAAGPRDDAERGVAAELIADLQQGRVDGAADRLGNIAWTAYEELFRGLPVVCLACTELPLAFPDFKSRASFEFCGALYVNTTAAHIDAIFDAAKEGEG
ncbi:MAG: aspartate/glutamate racemase family protein [Terracidiphilus sp.]